MLSVECSSTFNIRHSTFNAQGNVRRSTFQRLARFGSLGTWGPSWIWHWPFGSSGRPLLSPALSSTGVEREKRAGKKIDGQDNNNSACLAPAKKRESKIMKSKIIGKPHFALHNLALTGDFPWCEAIILAGGRSSRL